VTEWYIGANNDIFTLLYTCHENIQIPATSTSSQLGNLEKNLKNVRYRGKNMLPLQLLRKEKMKMNLIHFF